MYSDKYKHFAMRLHVELPDTLTAENPLADGWTVRLGEGVLASFYVQDVDNPSPKVKRDAVDVPGTNGSVYMTENTGRVYFEDKTVKVVLAGQGENANWHLFDALRSEFQGRFVDFTFDDYRNVNWFQTGRVSIDFDEKLCTFSIVFDEVKPFRYSTEVYQRSIAVRTNYEKHNNADAWNLDSQYGSPLYSDDNPGNFAYCYGLGHIGFEFIRTKGVGAAVGAKMLLGIQTLVGGDVWFEDKDGNKSKAVATCCPTTISGATSEIRMHFTIDGSYYEWHTIFGARMYLPTIRCTYSLSNYVPIDGNGEIANFGNDNVTFDFPSNVEIRPTVSGSYGIIIADGVAVPFDGSSRQSIVPRLVLPGANARKIGQKSRSYFCWIPTTNDDVTGIACAMRFIPVEVF